MLTKVGDELAPIGACESQPVPGFKDYVVGRWRALGHKVTDLTAEPSPQANAE